MIDLTLITPRLNDRHQGYLASAIEKLEAGVAAQFIRNIDFKDAKESLNRVIDKAIEHYDAEHREAHRAMGVWPHMIMGASNVKAGIRDAEKNGMTGRGELLKAMLPLIALAEAAKPFVKKRNEQPKVMSAKEIAEDAKKMTCQCCNRRIFAETGMIAHHGYERPGQGWQTASCYGARHLPFEVDRAVLGDLIKHMEQSKARKEEIQALIKAEELPVAVTLVDYSKPHDNRTGERPSAVCEVTRKDFVAFIKVLEETKNTHRTELYVFDTIKADDMRDRAAKIKNLADEIKAQKARYDGWKQTHKWEDGKWVGL